MGGKLLPLPLYPDFVESVSECVDGDRNLELGSIDRHSAPVLRKKKKKGQFTLKKKIPKLPNI